LPFCVILGGLGGVHLNAHQEVRAFMTDPVLQQRLAKYLVLQCFRNSILEDFHAGISPSSASGDYSDVTVSSPYGAVPWPKVSRLNDDEMKRLMIDVVDRTYRFLHTLFDENTGGELLLRLAHRDPLPQWKEPRLLPATHQNRARTDNERALHFGRCPIGCLRVSRISATWGVISHKDQSVGTERRTRSAHFHSHARSSATAACSTC
jgi:hypothetical protein